MKISLITPAPPRSRAGNRTTALRWARLLEELGHDVRIDVTYAGEAADLMVALHAWRSADSIERFKASHPCRPLIVALTGTDIYRDLDTHPETTLRSLDLADALVGLHDLVGEAVPARFREKLVVIFQSLAAPARRSPKLRGCFEVLVVGHLREVKDPFRAALAARTLPDASRVRIVHLGRAPTEEWRHRAENEMRANPRYVWRGEVSGASVKRLLARASVLVISSIMEGGANVVSEAIICGTPVLASDIPGSVGLLGRDYAGYFPVGDSAALAHLIQRAEAEPAFLARLREQCSARAPLFEPAREKEAWLSLVTRLEGASLSATAPRLG